MIIKELEKNMKKIKNPTFAKEDGSREISNRDSSN
jgi:hypothetical protein